MKETIKILAMRCDEENGAYKADIEEIPNTLEAMQDFVGGIIQVISLSSEICIVCNDDGKLMQLFPNRALVSTGKKIEDILAGNVFACRHQEDNFTSIRKSDIPFVLSKLPALMAVTNLGLWTVNEEMLPYYKSKSSSADEDL